jgi:hypothetical protein
MRWHTDQGPFVSSTKVTTQERIPSLSSNSLVFASRYTHMLPSVPDTWAVQVTPKADPFQTHPLQTVAEIFFQNHLDIINLDHILYQKGAQQLDIRRKGADDINKKFRSCSTDTNKIEYYFSANIFIGY